MIDYARDTVKAIEARYPFLVRWLIMYQNVKKGDVVDGETLLIHAARKGDYRTITHLLNSPGYNVPDLVGPDGKTALVHAVERRMGGAVKDILNLQPNIVAGWQFEQAKKIAIAQENYQTLRDLEQYERSHLPCVENHFGLDSLAAVSCSKNAAAGYWVINFGPHKLGQINGDGVQYQWSSGVYYEKYRGMFKDGLPEGQGVSHAYDADWKLVFTYTGAHENGKLHGWGRIDYVAPSKKPISGCFVGGEMIQAAASENECKGDNR